MDFDELDFEVETVLPVGKVRGALPMSRPSMVTPAMVEGYDVRKGLTFLEDAKALFDFDSEKLNPVQQLYIIAYAAKGTKTGACELVGVRYHHVKQWLENEHFREALQSATEMVQDVLEGELFRRAMNGSDRLLLAAIKAHKPERYAVKPVADVRVTGQVVHSWAELARIAKDEVKDVEYEDVEEDDDE